MPVIIWDDNSIDLVQTPRLRAIRNMLRAIIDLSNEERAEAAETEFDKQRHKFLAAVSYHIADEVNRFMPTLEEADKNDKLRKLFDIP